MSKQKSPLGDATLILLLDAELLKGDGTSIHNTHPNADRALELARLIEYARRTKAMEAFVESFKKKCF